MKQYSITSPKMTGAISVTYSGDHLSVIDFTGSEATLEQRQFFKKVVPVVHVHVVDFVKAYGFTCIETAFEVSFEMFWKEYPYKRNRLAAKDVFDKMKHADQVLAWDSAKEYAKYCARNKWYNAKIADSWLKKREFENNWKTL